MKSRAKKIILIAPLALLGIAVFITIGGVLVRWLWNAMLPGLFGWPQITFWQALGLLLLCRILFGGWRAGGPFRSGMRRRMEERCRERMEERFETMPPEEREAFRQRVRERWGFDPSTSERKEDAK